MIPVDEKEHAYLAGARLAHLGYLQKALLGLGRDGPEWNEKKWIMEREDAIITLRILCADFGDNDWPDNLHLTDIIQKHLEPYLHERQSP